MCAAFTHGRLHLEELHCFLARKKKRSPFPLNLLLVLFWRCFPNSFALIWFRPTWKPVKLVQAMTVMDRLVFTRFSCPLFANVWGQGRAASGNRRWKKVFLCLPYKNMVLVPCLWVVFSGRGVFLEGVKFCMLTQLSCVTTAVTQLSQISELVNSYLSLLHRALKMDVWHFPVASIGSRLAAGGLSSGILLATDPVFYILPIPGVLFCFYLGDFYRDPLWRYVKV